MWLPDQRFRWVNRGPLETVGVQAVICNERLAERCTRSRLLETVGVQAVICNRARSDRCSAVSDLETVGVQAVICNIAYTSNLRCTGSGSKQSACRPSSATSSRSRAPRRCRSRNSRRAGRHLQRDPGAAARGDPVVASKQSACRPSSATPRPEGGWPPLAWARNSRRAGRHLQLRRRVGEARRRPRPRNSRRAGRHLQPQLLWWWRKRLARLETVGVQAVICNQPKQQGHAGLGRPRNSRRAGRHLQR